MTATSPPRVASPTMEPTHEQWLTSLTDIVTVVAWRDEAIETNPNSTPTTSDSSLVTGRVRIFVSCECLSGGVA